MIYPSTDPTAFGYKHGILPDKNNCRKCGAEVDVNIPVISKDFVGFESLVHEPCGPCYKISHIKPRSEELKELLR